MVSLRSTPKGGFLFASAPLDASAPKKTVDVLVRATRQKKALDEMRRVADTLTYAKK